MTQYPNFSQIFGHFRRMHFENIPNIEGTRQNKQMVTWKNMFVMYKKSDNVKADQHDFDL
jgi:hypothetical protein